MAACRLSRLDFSYLLCMVNFGCWFDLIICGFEYLLACLHGIMCGLTINGVCGCRFCCITGWAGLC